MILAIANALPVASSTTRSVGARLRANSSNCSGAVAIRPADRARPPSAIATWQKSRWTSNPIDLPTRPLLLDIDAAGDGGQRDTYGFALAAHPGKSQGRPNTPTGSQPIRRRTACPTAFSQSPCPGTPTTLRPPPDSTGATPPSSFMPVHQAYGRDLVGLRAPEADPEQVRPLGCPVSGRPGAVLLTREHAERDAVF